MEIFIFRGWVAEGDCVQVLHVRATCDVTGGGAREKRLAPLSGFRHVTRIVCKKIQWDGVLGLESRVECRQAKCGEWKNVFVCTADWKSNFWFFGCISISSHGYVHEQSKLAQGLFRVSRVCCTLSPHVNE